MINITLENRINIHLLLFIKEEAMFIRAIYKFNSDYSNFNSAYQISTTPNANSLTT